MARLPEEAFTDDYPAARTRRAAGDHWTGLLAGEPMSLLTCTECLRGFPKPTGRGRPPTRCLKCRTKTSRPKAIKAKRPKVKLDEPKITSPRSVRTEPVQDLHRPPTGKGYRSGFCGGSMHPSLGWLTHAPEIHRMCSQISCICDCHQDHRVRSGNR